MLEGGDGNDVMTGGAGNDRIDGGTGDANVAIFTGNRSDYTIAWGNNWNGGQPGSLLTNHRWGC